MSLMDVADPEATLLEANRVLKPRGFAQFSIVHPVTSTRIRRWIDDDTGRRGPGVGDYFVEGPVTETWTFGAAPEEIQRQHRPFTITYVRRTLARWFEAFRAAGLVVDAIGEPCASEDLAAIIPRWPTPGSSPTSCTSAPGKDRSRDARTRRHPGLHRIGERGRGGDDLAPSLGARVPSCPDWSLTELIWHLGRVQRFWATTVHAGELDPEFPACTVVAQNRWTRPRCRINSLSSR